jgi:ABC-type branched-subunit amino acid transport system ATPase component/ABC-type branched-subunit amino acid transport system permease subunit
MQALVFLLLGLANGAVFASLAIGLVITYRSSGVINFATGAIALFGAYEYAFLREGQLFDPIPGLAVSVNVGGNWPFAAALTAALAMSAVLGLLLYVLIFRPLRTAPPVARAVASIGVVVVLTALIAQRLGTSAVNVSAIFPTKTYSIGKAHVSGDRMWFAVTVVVVAVALSLAYKYTRFGLHTRAAAESEKGAFVSGISPDRIAASNWMISSAVAGLAGILIAPIVPLVPTAYTLFIIPALAAAIIGRFQYMIWAVVAGLAIGMIQSEMTYVQARNAWLPSSGLPELVPLLLIIIMLVIWAKPLPSRGAVIQQTLGRAPRPGPIALPTLACTTAGVVALVALSGAWRAALLTSLIFGVISLSLVVVTGYAGQVSFAQLTLAGVAGFILSPMTESWGIPFPVAPILAALVATGIGVLVGLPALRVRGLPFAVVTLALAVTVEAIWFENTHLVGASGLNIKGPTLFGINLGIGTGTAYPRLIFCLMALATLVVVAVGVAKLRTSRLGSAMLAVRSNERSASAAGIDVVRTKLIAFALAAFIAGIGGSLLAYKQGNVTFDAFDTILGLAVFATAYLAGITSVSGGVLAGILGAGGIVYLASDRWLHLGGWYAVVTGAGLILTVVFKPEGIVGPLHEKLAARRLGASDRTALTGAAAAAAGAPAATGTPAGPVLKPVEVRPPSRALLGLEGVGVTHGGHAADRTALTGAPAPAGPVLKPVEVRPPSPALLALEGVGVTYGGVVAVRDVSLKVPEGSIVGLIGPNGAGKTTLIDAMSGFAPSQGIVTLDGRRLDGLKPHERVRAGLGRTFQGIELWNDLSVRENIGVGLAASAGRRNHAAPGADALGRVLDVLGLGAVAERPTGELSQGQRQLVSIARALVGQPKVLLLDEPAGGLDSTESLWLAKRLRDIRNAGITVVLIDHDMGLVLSLCDWIHVLDFGSVIASGAPAAIRADRAVAEAYLGSTHAELAADAK